VKAVIRYFSGTGNTRFLANAFAVALQRKGYIINCSSIEDDQEASELGSLLAEDGSLLVVGGPIMAGNVPEKLIRWVLRTVPPSPGGKALVFTSSAGLENANGVHSLARKLAKKGYQVLDQPVFRMPRNYYFGRYHPTPPDEQLQMIQNVPAKVAATLAGVVDAGAGSAREVPALQSTGKVLSLDLMAELFSLIARSMGRKFTSFHDECINCGRCIDSCPQKNIEKRAGGGVVFNGKCMLCTRCLHGCPVNAIGYDNVRYEQYRGPEGLKA
jgi:ferredoxin